jgi:uncharacterized RDD family membrane protein YckC
VDSQQWHSAGGTLLFQVFSVVLAYLGGNSMINQFPALSQRILSLVIDQVLILAMMLVCAGLIDKLEQPPDWIRIALFFGIGGLYEPLCTTFGCTLGNYVVGIRVRKTSDKMKRINLLQAYVRWIVKALLGWLSFLTINMNKERRAIHDLAAATVMIKV